MSNFSRRTLAHESIASSHPPATNAINEHVEANQSGPISISPKIHPASPNPPQVAANFAKNRQSSWSWSWSSSSSSTSSGHVNFRHVQNFGAVSQVGAENSVRPPSR